MTKKVNKENHSFYTSSVETSKKQYANYHKDIEKSAEIAKSRAFLFRGDDEHQVSFDENDSIQSMMSFHHKAPEWVKDSRVKSLTISMKCKAKEIVDLRFTLYEQIKKLNRID